MIKFSQYQKGSTTKLTDILRMDGNVASNTRFFCPGDWGHDAIDKNVDFFSVWILTI